MKSPLHSGGSPIKANENPFRSSELERIRYSLSDEELRALAKRAVKLCQCSLLGSHGTGKTTLLEDLEPHIHKEGYSTDWTRLNRDSTMQERRQAMIKASEIQAGGFYLLDGAEVLSRWQQFRLPTLARMKRIGLIVTLHRQTRLPILYHSQADWHVAGKLVRQLAKQNCSEELLGHAKIAFEKSNGNMREVFRACYWKLAT